VCIVIENGNTDQRCPKWYPQPSRAMNISTGAGELKCHEEGILISKLKN
jgi:hypothetical protein